MRSLKGFVLLLVTLAVSGAASAQTRISVFQTWDKSGNLMTESETFKATFAEHQDAFSFHPDGTIEVKPAQAVKPIILSGPIAFGVLPSRVIDDVIYDPNKYPDAREIHVPAENVFMGLLGDEDRILICAWPDGEQKVRLLLGALSLRSK